ncbi:MAG: DUF362 domain-containing protein [Candidatus Bathyarchaeota archaeon]|jgi:uncharacterized protein (DUF362 family)|nr:DUF362 domain-containing protein [Candidatus Bathyarchaeota archaeon A05DMB-5]MDH7557672.1 DUF362 domain-containing protein [Candidatus Bathyarchaeota archaeon]
MVVKVAVMELGSDVRESFNQAIQLIGGIDDLNTPQRSVIVKVGVFDHRTNHHTSVDVADAIINSFDKAPKIFLAESENYKGKALERLQKWNTLFSERVVPFDLSGDAETKQVKVADEMIDLSHILFKPNVFVSTHVLRTYEKGSILKNLLGLIPDRKKVRFHKKLEETLLDLYEAVGGVDLAVLDGTYLCSGVAPSANRTSMNVLVVGRDAVAVEAVGYALVGLNPEKIPVIKEAMKRGFGEGRIDKIRVLGGSFESAKERVAQLLKASKKKTKKSKTEKKAN